MLVGRGAEQATITTLLEAARGSTGGSLVIRGVAGNGKSTLLADAIASASDMRVLRTQGVESESPLAFAALQRLLWPLRRHLNELPKPQAAALGAALGEAEGEGDRFLVFLGVLSLLADVAEEQPLLVCVDDAQWLDEASAAALLFVARRLQAERIALLFTVRDGEASTFDSRDLPQLNLAGIAADAAERLLMKTGAIEAVDPAVRDRLFEATGGNPLALVELASALTAGQFAGAEPLPDELPLTGGVERAFGDRYRRLSESAQRLLLVAAADDSGHVAVVRGAAAQLGADDLALDEVERAGLLRVEVDTVTMYHPLVRSAVYSAATSALRRAAHRALANSLGSVGDRERAAWHAAAAAEGADDAVADELDAVASAAAGRGGHEAASSAWARAAELTAEPARRAGRYAAAATAAFAGAQTGRARSVVEAALRDAGDPLVRADMELLRARVEWNVGSPRVAHRLLLRGAADVVAADEMRARRMTMLANALISFVGGDLEDPADLTVRFSDVDAATDDASRCAARLTAGFGHMRVHEYAEAAAQFRAAYAEFREGDDSDLHSNLGISAAHLGDDDVVLEHHGWLCEFGRMQGALVLVVYSLSRRAFAEIATGDWSAATSGAAEALDLATGAGQPALTLFPRGWLALLAAFRGDVHGATRHLDALAANPAEGIAASFVRDVACWTRAVIADSPASAIHQLEQIKTGLVARLAAFDRIETAVHADRRDLAEQWTDEILGFGTAVQAEWATAQGEYGMAMLADGEDADTHFKNAVAHAENAHHRFERARIHLAYGEHLRRTRRRVDAREHLRTALDIFEDLGAKNLAARATQELRASGETARRREVGAADELTPQERQVASLVRQGMSNRDAAAQLFLSPRTVDFHLRNVFQKLGITSRAELAAMQMESESSSRNG
ncbi:MAG TPA: AAA family ATPase [Mycobacteriales bacterium]|nr:AAA family ATPase [Mycobacteriales bacterium]